MTPMGHDYILYVSYMWLAFPQTFCFDYFGFDPWVFLNNDHAMIVMMNAQPYMTLHLDDIF